MYQSVIVVRVGIFGLQMVGQVLLGQEHDDDVGFHFSLKVKSLLIELQLSLRRRFYALSDTTTTTHEKPFFSGRWGEIFY